MEELKENLTMSLEQHILLQTTILNEVEILATGAGRSVL